MADESQTIRGINWRETFSFTHLFRTFRIAVHPSKLILGLLLIFSLFAGGKILDALWPQSSLPGAYDVQQYEVSRWQRAAGHSVDDVLLAEQAAPVSPAATGISNEFFNYEIVQASGVMRSTLYGNWPQVIHGVTNFLIIGPTWLARAHTVYCILFAGVFLLAWAVFGGAISRIAAVHVARDEKISLRQAMSFSCGKILSFIFAPLIPIIIIFVIGIALAVAGLLFYVPWVGPVVFACLFIGGLLGGFVMTLVATGMIGGLNLMYPTVAVEGSDSFDAISRSFSYVFARPWRMLFYTAVALLYGAVCYAFAHWFVFVMLKLTHLFASWWLGGQPGFYFPQIWPAPEMQSLLFRPNFESLKGTEAVAASIIRLWIDLVIALLGAFVISFYFTASTIIYYLMRQEVDATELDDVYVEEIDEDLNDAPASARPTDPQAATEVIVASETVILPMPDAPPAPQPPAST
jgi:hypothetical protein